MRSWFCLVNQVAYSFAQVELMAPFHEQLSSKNKKFYWNATLDGIFEASKKKIVELIIEGVNSFKMKRATCLSSDWSMTGLSFFLHWQHCSCPTAKVPDCGNGHWKLIFSGSHFTTDAESRYASVEGEALALIYALESCHMFVLGCPLLMISGDHKPLTAIFGQCWACNRITPSQPKEPLADPLVLEFSFQQTVIYFCYNSGHKY